MPEDHEVQEGRERINEEDKEELVEEGAKVRIVKMVEPPTKQEFDEHMSSHIPFRSWCPYCCSGKGISQHHKSGDRQEGSIPTVAIYYAFMGQ